MAPKIRFAFFIAASGLLLWFASALPAQDLGPQFKKIKEGIYVEAPPQGGDKYPTANCSIVVSHEGVILINSGATPLDARLVQAAVKKLTPLPVRFIIDTETHLDHTANHFVFFPPATVIAQEGTTEAMLDADSPQRISALMAQSPEMREAAQGDALVTPHIEFRDKMIVRLGERSLYLMATKNVHSEADTLVWLPFDGVLFAASAFTPNAFQPIGDYTTATDVITSLKFMRSLNPEIVVPAHGAPGTAKYLDDAIGFWTLLLSRVDKMVQDGQSLEQTQKQVMMPEYSSWAGREYLQENITGAWRGRGYLAPGGNRPTEK